MRVLALRGATTVERDDADSVISATGELLDELLTSNGASVDDLISVIFTATPDLTAEFPAAAARSRGMSEVALLCATELAVPGAPERCIRVLIHLETDRPREQLQHVYLRGARGLRTDLTED